MSDALEYFVSKKTLKEYCGRKHSPLHPNRISALGGASTVVGTLMLVNPYSAPVGVGAIVLGDVFADHYDGKLARRFKLKTKQGAKLDPLFDKVKNIAIGSYVLFSEGLDNPLTWVFGASVLADVISQRQRGPLLEQIVEAYHAVVSPEFCEDDLDKNSSIRATNFGKWKTGIQAGVHIVYGLTQAIPVDYIFSNSVLANDVDKGLGYLMGGFLATSIVLGSVGIVQRMRNES